MTRSYRRLRLAIFAAALLGLASCARPAAPAHLSWGRQLAYAVGRAQQADPQATLVRVVARPADYRNPTGPQAVEMWFSLAPEARSSYNVSYTDSDVERTWAVDTSVVGVDTRDRLDASERARRQSLIAALQIGPLDAIRASHGRAEPVIGAQPYDWIVSAELYTDPRVRTRWGVDAVWKVWYIKDLRSVEIWVDAQDARLVYVGAQGETVTL